MVRRFVIAGFAGVAIGIGCGVWLLLEPPQAPDEPPSDRGPVKVSRRDPSPARPAPPPDAPHVVLLLGCTVRRDQIGAYGGPPGVTPFLDALAARGARFEDPIAAAPWTRPASAAIVTGRHPTGIGVFDPGPGRDDSVLPDGVVTLAERFADAGWTTIGAAANPNLSASYGFDQGFDVYLQPRGLWRDGEGRLSGDRLLPPLFAALDTRPAPERPVFLQVMLVDAHAPLPDDPGAFAAPGVDPELARYRAALHRADRAFARLVDGLATRLDPDRTRVFFVSDHGEGLEHPPHHGRSHGRYLYGSAVHAAWIAAGAGVPPGGVVPGLASHVDVAPTVLGSVGLPGLGVGRDLWGRVVRPGPTGRRLAHSDTWFQDVERASVRSERTACVVAGPSDVAEAPSGRFIAGCFDRATDPLEERPFVDDALVAQLMSWWDVERAAVPDRETAPRDPETDDQLRALGYLDPP